jgi:hypothetical protein
LGSTARTPLDARLKDGVILAVAEEGLDGLDPRAICVRARASEAEFHERWPDGWALLVAAFDERALLPELPDTGTLVGDLVAYVGDYARFCADPIYTKVVFFLLAASKSDANLRARMGPGFAERRVRNLVVIKRAIARGELPAGINGNVILDAMLSLGLSWNAGGGAPAEAEIRRCVERAIAAAQSGAPSAAKAVRTRPPNMSPEDAYRLYLFEDSSAEDRRGGVSEVEALHGRSEEEAIAAANARRCGRYAELWKARHLIRIFDPD